MASRRQTPFLSPSTPTSYRATRSRPSEATPATTSPPAGPSVAPISLLSPRPPNQRHGNEYFESPPPLGAKERVPPIVPAPPVPPPSATAAVFKCTSAAPGRPPSRPMPPLCGGSEKSSRGPLICASYPFPAPQPPSSSTVCVEQPKKSSCPPTSSPPGSSSPLICPTCGKCQCAACRSAPGLPQCWLWQSRCLCSQESCVDYASCMCTAKAIFYHCRAHEEDSWAENPCGCSAPGRVQRWTTLTALSACLPCLCCYWPLRGLVGATNALYKVYQRSRGCQCEEISCSVTSPESSELLT